MTEADYKFTTETLDRLRNSHAEGVSRICSAFMRGVHRDWSKKYPKRQLRFVEDMGTMCWTIDDRIVYGCTIACSSYGYTLARSRMKKSHQYLGIIYHPRLVRMLKPLQDAINWYCKYCDYQVVVEVGNIE